MADNVEEFVTITKKEYEALLFDSAWYNSLQAAGVDNWDGYGDAFDILEEDYPQYKDV